MNPLALSLLGLKAGQTASRPAPSTSLPPVPHEVFGLNLLTVGKADRARLRALRFDTEASYLRDHGPLPTADMAKSFGLSNEAMFKDLRTLELANRIRRTGDPKCPQWEAA